MKHRELLKDVKSKGKELDKLEPDINILKQLLLLFSTDPGLPLFASVKNNFIFFFIKKKDNFFN